MIYLINHDNESTGLFSCFRWFQRLFCKTPTPWKFNSKSPWTFCKNTKRKPDHWIIFQASFFSGAMLNFGKVQYQPCIWYQDVVQELGGGFKYLLFSPILGEDSYFDSYYNWLGCDIGGAKELRVIYFPTIWGAKEPQNLPNHRVVGLKTTWKTDAQNSPMKDCKLITVILSFPFGWFTPCVYAVHYNGW